MTTRAQIHNIRWASQEAREQYPDVNLDDWDAAAECAFAPSRPPPRSGADGPAAKLYDDTVILPDERRFLLNEALQHLRVVAKDSVVGERVEFVVGGEAVEGMGEGDEGMMRVWEGWRVCQRAVEGKEED